MIILNFLGIICITITLGIAESAETDCVPIKSCPKLTNLLNENKEIKRLLHYAQCGFDEQNGIKVWCTNLSTCKTQNGKTGTCMSLFKCKSALRNLKKPELHSQLIFNNFQCNDNPEDMCCPDTHNFEENSLTKLPDANLKECGIQELNANKVFGGTETELAEFPWTALLIYEKIRGGYTYGCGGSLINSRYVVTAAHCVDEHTLKIVKLKSLYKIVLGEYDVRNETDCIHLKIGSECSEKPTYFDAEKIIQHGSFNAATLKNDIALIRLANPVQFSVYIRPICLPSINDRLNGNDNLMIAGWGKMNNFARSPVKRKATLKISNPSVCNKLSPTKYHLSDGQLCAGIGNGVDTCKGDSGGPLMLSKVTEDADFQSYLYGVVSYGVGKCGKAPSVFTYIPLYISWIQENL